MGSIYLSTKNLGRKFELIWASTNLGDKKFGHNFSRLQNMSLVSKKSNMGISLTVKLRTPDRVRTVKIVNFPKLKRSGTLLVRTLLSRNKLVRELCGPVVSWSESLTSRNLHSHSVWCERSVFSHQNTAPNL